MIRDTVIFLLQQLGFVQNLEKSFLTPSQRIEFIMVTLARFMKHDPVFTKEESSEAFSRTSSENSSVNFKINNRLTGFNYSSSTSSTNKFKLPTTTKNASIKNTGIILQKSDYKLKLQNLDTKFENQQWLLLNSVSQSSAEINRCI